MFSFIATFQQLPLFRYDSVNPTCCLYIVLSWSVRSTLTLASCWLEAALTTPVNSPGKWCPYDWQSLQVRGTVIVYDQALSMPRSVDVESSLLLLLLKSLCQSWWYDAQPAHRSPSHVQMSLYIKWSCLLVFKFIKENKALKFSAPKYEIWSQSPLLFLSFGWTSGQKKPQSQWSWPLTFNLKTKSFPVNRHLQEVLSDMEYQVMTIKMFCEVTVTFDRHNPITPNWGQVRVCAKFFGIAGTEEQNKDTWDLGSGLQPDVMSHILKDQSAVNHSR